MKHEILVYNKTSQKTPKKFIVHTILEILSFLKIKQPIELAVLIVDKSQVKRLNKIWLGKNKPADELSFGLNSRQISKPACRQAGFAKDNNGVLELGEIVINADKVSDRGYLLKILVHSLLHLLGYHHEKSAAEAKKSERLEERILKYLKHVSRRYCHRP